MSWKLRHAGSPQVISGLTPQQIVEGLTEDEYEPSDEVMGPTETKWTAMEEHPHFEETVELWLETQEEEHIDSGEDHIDMNPLIDVCLVLLVIFIMAQSMAFLEKVIEAPKSQAKSKGLTTVNITDLPPNMILLDAEVRDGKAIIKVDGNEVTVKELPDRLKQIRFNNDKKDTLVIKHKGGVTHGTIVYICDSAAQANIRHVKLGSDAAASPGGAATPPQ